MANQDTQVLVTGASGIGGDAVCRLLLDEGFRVRAADVAPPQPDLRDLLRERGSEFLRCDTRTPADCVRAVEGVQAVAHLAAWHCAHQPPVSDDTIWGVNVDGTFNLFQACRAQGVKAVAFASSMAFGWGGVYSVSKVIGEDLCRCLHESTGASVAMLRYHDFVPKPYLDFGVKLLRNGVDRRDVASATVASIKSALDGRIGLFQTVIHTAHGMPPEAVQNFRELGPAWCEEKVPGSRALMEKYAFDLPERVEQHDMSEAARLLDWRPKSGFLEFLRDLQEREARGEDVRKLWAPGQIPTA
jgi:nucleoside-diphosphate-sugar epimerase